MTPADVDLMPHEFDTINHTSKHLRLRCGIQKKVTSSDNLNALDEGTPSIIEFCYKTSAIYSH
jgi:hypothetical protein